MPGEEVDLDQFVKIMREVFKETMLEKRDEFISELVDLFYRINKDCKPAIAFEDMTTYLIDHEIAYENGGLNASNAKGLNMVYEESPIKDPTIHNSYIENIYYFPQIDKVILYEENMKIMRIYNGVTLRNEHEITCPGYILAIEYITCKNSICVSLSDRTFLFFDAGSAQYKQQRKFNVASTQRCLCYVDRKRLLFSAGTDGAVFAWIIDKIFQQNENDDLKGEQQNENKKDLEYRNYITENTPWFLMGHATCIVDLPNIDLIATGSYRKRIELWVLRTQNNSSNQNAIEEKEEKADKKTTTQKDKKSRGSSKSKTAKQKEKREKNFEMEEDISQLKKKTLEGHKRAIREITYSESYKIMVSVGFDFQIFVWNPYWEKEIIKLDGHESPLVGVNCPAGLDCFITCDQKGVVNVWNIKDYSCMQTFTVSNVIKVSSMRVVPKHRRLLIGSRVFKVFEYKKPFVHDVSDDNPIMCALFSNIRFEFYIAGGRSINVWNAKTGKPTRCLKNVFDSDITALALDKQHRKLIVGSHLGKLKVYDILSGVMTNELDSHSEENGEISFIGYGDEDMSIITTAWDKTIKIHKDDRDEQKQPIDNVMRAKRYCHKKDIICGDYAHNLGLIATGGRDAKVKIWEYERMKFEDEISVQNEVSIVKFLKPFQLLLIADNAGEIQIWKIELDQGEKPFCCVSWKNNHSIEKVSTLTAVDYFYNDETGEFTLIMGDENGMVKIQDLTYIIQHYQLQPKDFVTGNTKRNPHRFMPVEKYTLDMHDHDGDNNSEDGGEKPKVSHVQADKELDGGNVAHQVGW